MKLEFKKLDIMNFMSIGHVELDFDRFLGFTSIQGINYEPADNARSNGSGKSTLFEALIWCLTGETVRGNKDVVNRNCSDGTGVSLEFTVDGVDYIVSRYRNHKEFKTNLLIKRNGQDISGKGIRDSEKVLQECLPELTASLLGSVVILGQGMPARFTNNTPAARKEVLEKLTQSDFMIEDVKNRISARKFQLNDESQQCSRELVLCGGLLTETQTRLTELHDKVAKLQDISVLEAEKAALLDQIESQQSQVTELDESVSNLSKELDVLTRSYNQKELLLNTELQSLKDEYNEQSASNTASIAAAEASIALIEKSIQRAKQVTDVCPTCGQKIPGVVFIDTREEEAQLVELRERVSALSRVGQELYQEYRVKRWTEVELQHQDTLRSLKQDIFNATAERQAAKSKQDALIQSIKSLERQEAAVELNIAQRSTLECELMKEIDQCTARLEELERQLPELQKQDSKLSVRLGILSKFETIVKRDFRGYLLQDIIVYINKRAKHYSQVVFGTDLLDFSLDGNSIAISYNGKSYESLSGGERQKIDIIVQFAIRDVLSSYTGFQTNILVLDEIFDNLDDVGSTKIVDMLATELSDVSSIFVISHHAKELRLPYDRELVVCKGADGVSYIE